MPCLLNGRTTCRILIQQATLNSPPPPYPHTHKHTHLGMSRSRNRGQRRHSGEAIDEAVEEVDTEEVQLGERGGKQGEGL